LKRATQWVSGGYSLSTLKNGREAPTRERGDLALQEESLGRLPHAMYKNGQYRTKSTAQLFAFLQAHALSRYLAKTS